MILKEDSKGSLVKEKELKENREIEPVGRRRFLGSPPRPALPGGRFTACRYLLVLIMTRGVMVVVVVVVVVAILGGRTPTGPENQDQMILSFFRSENGFWFRLLAAAETAAVLFCSVLFCFSASGCVKKSSFRNFSFPAFVYAFWNFFQKNRSQTKAHVTFCRRFGYRYLKEISRHFDLSNRPEHCHTFPPPITLINL